MCADTAEIRKAAEKEPLKTERSRTMEQSKVYFLRGILLNVWKAETDTTIEAASALGLGNRTYQLIRP